MAATLTGVMGQEAEGDKLVPDRKKEKDDAFVSPISKHEQSSSTVWILSSFQHLHSASDWRDVSGWKVSAHRVDKFPAVFDTRQVIRHTCDTCDSSNYSSGL